MGRKKTLSVLKRERQNEKRRLRNRWYKIRIKRFFKMLAREKDENRKKEIARELQSIIDKGVKRGVLHRNTGARKKSKIKKFLGL